MEEHYSLLELLQAREDVLLVAQRLLDFSLLDEGKGGGIAESAPAVCPAAEPTAPAQRVAEFLNREGLIEAERPLDERRSGRATRGGC